MKENSYVIAAVKTLDAIKTIITTTRAFVQTEKLKQF
jgi:hypothetical protein